MGFELNAFLGRASELRTWTGRLRSAVVCELSGELAMVPATGALFQELRTRLGEEEANRLDTALGYRAYPSPSHEEAARRWAAEASRGTTIAYVSTDEFGNMGHDEATVWSEGKEILSGINTRAVLDHFLNQVGLDLGDESIDLEQHRGENAAEKWAAAAQKQPP